MPHTEKTKKKKRPKRRISRGAASLLAAGIRSAGAGTLTLADKQKIQSFRRSRKKKMVKRK